jgi:hypothetical protein
MMRRESSSLFPDLALLAILHDILVKIDVSNGSTEEFQVQHARFPPYHDVHLLAPGLLIFRGAFSAGVELLDVGRIIFDFESGCPGRGLFSEVFC